MPLYARLPQRIAIAIEALVPVIVVALILVVVWLSFAVTADAAHQRVVSCAAVNNSNDRTFEFFQAAVARGPHAHDAATLAELHNLRLTYDTIARECKVGA